MVRAVRRTLTALGLAVVTVFVAIWLSVPGSVAVHADQRAPVAASPKAGGSSAAAQPADADGWNFDDEQEAVPSLRDTLAPQALDLVIFPLFLALALLSFFRKSVTLKIVTLVASIVYLGIARSQLYSVVNIFGLLSWNLPIVKHNIFWYLFAAFTLGSTVIWGRLYCGRMCAFGALTQLMDRVVPSKWRHEPSLKTETQLAWIKYAVLGAVVIYYLITRDITIYRYVEPFWMFSGHGSMVMWAMLTTLLVATVFVRNLYCRFLCPVGAFLGVISKATTLLPIKRWAECKSCKICEKTCEWGAIQGPRIVKSECVRCDDCERLYMDQQKCVHWIVIRKKSEIMARQSGVPPAPLGL